MLPGHQRYSWQLTGRSDEVVENWSVRACGKNVIDTQFFVINADDYYGKKGFEAVHDYLVNGGKSCIAGFVLKNTLSENGDVTCGICKTSVKVFRSNDIWYGMTYYEDV